MSSADTSNAGPGATLYERLGGQAAVEAAVDIFYEKVIPDPKLARFFEGYPMERLKKHQVAFMTMAFGGSKKYSGRSIAAAHSKLIREQGLRGEHFDVVAGHLVASLQQLAVPQALIDEVVAIVGPLRPIFEPAEEVAASAPAAAAAAAAAPKEAAAPASLYDRLGGAAAVEAAVDIFYQKVIPDPKLARFFEGYPMERLKKHQVAFMTMAFGGSKKYSGRSIAAAHSKLIREQGLRGEHFDVVAGHLVASLQQLAVPQALIDEVVAIVGPLRPIFEPAEEVAASAPAAAAAAAPKEAAAAAPKEAEAAAPASLYDRLGGAAAVEAAVDIFYQKVIPDPKLARFFEGYPMERLKKHQVAFMTMAFGGSKKYSGRSIAAAHSKLIREQGLRGEHFDVVAGHLVASLQQLAVPQALIDEVVAIVGPLRPIFEPAEEVGEVMEAAPSGLKAEGGVSATAEAAAENSGPVSQGFSFRKLLSGRLF